MKKLEDYKGQKIAIHFPTYELWLRRKEINPSDDLKDEYWNRHGKKFYYNPFYNDGYGGFDIEDYYIKNNYTVLPATDFLEDDFIYGKEYEFSDTKNHWNKRQFMVKTPCGEFIGYNKETQSAVSWKYCRKINTVLPATDFLEDDFIYGKEYEFSDTKNHWNKRQFMVKTPCGEFIGYDKETQSAVSWKYCRKINTERTEAIATIKELVSKFSINQNEVF